jgi:hypothetical protein
MRANRRAVAAIFTVAAPPGPRYCGIVSSICPDDVKERLMSRFLEHKAHLARMAGLFAVGITTFFVVRHLLVPPQFGLYGHFRPGSLADNMKPALVYAGQTACADCHPDVVDARRGNKHRRVACEACHGPLASHAASPGETVPTRPNGRESCLLCHLFNVARPKAFPQVRIPEHTEAGPCLACHKPHAPAIAPAAQ